MEKKSHYFLIAGTLVLQENNLKDEPEKPISQITLNTVITNDRKEFSVAQIAEAQQGLQHNFYQKFEEKNTKVIDVTILSVSYLGEMTAKEFHKAPEAVVTMPTKATH